MLALPEPILSLAELQALTEWKTRYSAESLIDVEGMDPAEARRVTNRLHFLAWAYRAGRLTD